MSKEGLLQKLKDPKLSPLDVIKQNSAGISYFDSETTEALVQRVQQDSATKVKAYFDTIENPNFINEPIPNNVKNVVSEIQDLRSVISYYCLKPLKDKLKATDWEKKIVAYGSNHSQIEQMIDQGLLYLENEDQKFEIYDVKKGKVGFDCPALSLRQIFIQELNIPESDPWFYIILAYNMTQEFAKSAQTYYVYNGFIKATWKKAFS